MYLLERPFFVHGPHQNSRTCAVVLANDFIILFWASGEKFIITHLFTLLFTMIYITFFTGIESAITLKKKKKKKEAFLFFFIYIFYNL